MTFMFWLAVAVALAMAWSLWGRDWLKGRGWRWSDAFFAWIEPIEIALFKNSKVIFMARLKMLTGLLLTLGTQLGSVDITPIMPFVPDAWEPTVQFLWNLLPLGLTIIGWMDEQLRKQTSLPLEVVAAPEVVKANLPEVQKMEEAKADAVAAVESVKAQVDA